MLIKPFVWRHSRCSRLRGFVKSCLAIFVSIFAAIFAAIYAAIRNRACKQSATSWRFSWRFLTNFSTFLQRSSLSACVMLTRSTMSPVVLLCYECKPNMEHGTLHGKRRRGDSNSCSVFEYRYSFSLSPPQKKTSTLATIFLSCCL